MKENLALLQDDLVDVVNKFQMARLAEVMNVFNARGFMSLDLWFMERDPTDSSLEADSMDHRRLKDFKFEFNAIVTAFDLFDVPVNIYHFPLPEGIISFPFRYVDEWKPLDVATFYRFDDMAVGVLFSGSDEHKDLPEVQEIVNDDRAITTFGRMCCGALVQYVKEKSGDTGKGTIQ